MTSTSNRTYAAMLLLLSMVATACGPQPSTSTPTSSSATASRQQDERAVELCRTSGREAADERATVERIDEVYATTLADVVQWQEHRYEEITGAPGDSEWQGEEGSTFAAICYFDAGQVVAPGGPAYPTTDPSTGDVTFEPLPPYDEVVVIVADDGRVELYEARRSEMNEGSGSPAKAPERSRRMNESD